jgi:hypothetical protein
MAVCAVCKVRVWIVFDGVRQLSFAAKLVLTTTQRLCLDGQFPKNHPGDVPLPEAVRHLHLWIPVSNESARHAIRLHAPKQR